VGRIDDHLCAGHAEQDCERGEPLLRAVVQVPREPLPLGVGGLDDAGSSGADLIGREVAAGARALGLTIARV
jgi:hypothetical protein